MPRVECRFKVLVSRPVFTNPIHLDVKSAFLQHRTLIDKWTTWRRYTQVDCHGEMRAMAFLGGSWKNATSGWILWRFLCSQP